MMLDRRGNQLRILTSSRVKLLAVFIISEQVISVLNGSSKLLCCQTPGNSLEKHLLTVLPSHTGCLLADVMVN